MRRNLAIAAGVALALLAVYFVFLGNDSVEPELKVELPTSVIGEGEDAVAVSPEGLVLSGRPVPKEGTLPRLPATELPKGGRLRGTLLEQARVLGAAPEVLRACIARSSYGETGVEVELRSGIELGFGDATRASEKWRSAIALLADPSITALDYVDLHSPGRPAVYGEGHTLPSAEEGSGAVAALERPLGEYRVTEPIASFPRTTPVSNIKPST